MDVCLTVHISYVLLHVLGLLGYMHVYTNTYYKDLYTCPNSLCMILNLSDLCQPCTPYTCRVSGPGLHSATANRQTHIELELIDKDTEEPFSQLQKIIAQLEYVSETTPNCSIPLAVYAEYTCPYKVYYKAVTRGQYKLHIWVNDTEIDESPLTITVYPDTTQLAHPESEAQDNRGDCVHDDVEVSIIAKSVAKPI